MLAGDYCYAHGLVRIAAAGDLFVIDALADLIALGAGHRRRVAARAALAPLWRATTRGDRRPRRARPRRGGRALPRGQGRAAIGTGATGRSRTLAAGLPPTPGLEEALT